MSLKLVTLFQLTFQIGLREKVNLFLICQITEIRLKLCPHGWFELTEPDLKMQMFHDWSKNLQPVFSERRVSVRRNGNFSELVWRHFAAFHLRRLRRHRASLNAAVHFHSRRVWRKKQKKNITSIFRYKTWCLIVQCAMVEWGVNSS